MIPNRTATGWLLAVLSVFSIVAAVRARRGQMFYFPFFGLLAYRAAFGERRVQAPPVVNRPPV